MHGPSQLYPRLYNCTGVLVAMITNRAKILSAKVNAAIVSLDIPGLGYLLGGLYHSGIWCDLQLDQKQRVNTPNRRL